MAESKVSHSRAGFATAVTMTVLVFLLGLLMASAASAQTTHKLLETWNTPARSGPEVQAVDRNGYVYVLNSGDITRFNEATISKYDAHGNPVNFSALGSNTIDGKGADNCPATPADCDRVPSGHINASNNWDHSVAVDISDGPASGYIYVINGSGGMNGATQVFAPSGKYLGEIDRTRSYPKSAIGTDAFGAPGIAEVSTDINGHIYAAYGNTDDSLDQYAPVDGNPAHDVFIGQLRRPANGGGHAFEQGVGGQTYTYAIGGGPWTQFDQAAFRVQTDPTPQVRQGKELWGGIGASASAGVGQDIQLSIDPRNEDVYLVDGFSHLIRQWDKESTHQIGPIFGGESIGVGIGFDVSGGPNDGHLYIRGEANKGDSINVYSGPVPIPDVTYDPPTIGHFDAVVHGHVGLSGGPDVTDCRVEYGHTGGYELGSIPCDVATPYQSETGVNVELPGLQIETDYHYRIVASNANGVTRGEDQVIHTVAVLSASTDPATNITPTTATLNGRLDPDGMQVTYHFEYGITSSYDFSTPTATTGPGSGVVPVAPADLTQLQPGRTYHYALVATDSLGTTIANDRTFTAAHSPRISGVRTTDVGETSAVLHAKINPFGFETTYHFEYGLTPDYGSRTPAHDEVVGAGYDPQEIVANLVGLQSGVVYHFRVVATNQWGTSYGDDTTFSFFPPDCPNAHIRQVTASNYLPDCRAYELVSPGEATGVQLLPGDVTDDFKNEDKSFRIVNSNVGQATGPSRFAFWGSFGSLQGTDVTNSIIDLYVATRTPTGWMSRYPGVPGGETRAALRPLCSITLDKCIDYKSNSIDPKLADINAPYVWNADGNSVSLGRWPTNLGVVPGGEHFVGEQKPSGDFTHFVFSSDLTFTPGGSPGAVYDNDVIHNSIEIVSKTASGEDIEGPLRIRAVSTDGSHILMTTDSTEGAADVYLRVNDAVTYEIGRGISLLGMSRSGSKAIFASNKKLTADDTDTSADMYVWSEATNSLTRISRGSGGQGNSDDCTTIWVSKCGAKQLAPERPDTDNLFAPGNGDAFFYSPENLDASNPGVPNQRNLYEWHDGTVRLVATLDPETTVSRIQISPNGDHAAFVTDSQLTGYDNAGYAEMYSYDAQERVVKCVSCLPNGDPPSADVTASKGGIFMSDDGRAFFSTTDALVPEDTNNGITDVYEYVDGRPQLITAGNGSNDFYGGTTIGFFKPHRTGLEGVSADGVDVYFSTFDTLVPQDHNGSFLKFYDARTGGGFPVAPSLLPCAAADECHGVDSSPPPGLQNGTGAALGAGGNVHRAQKDRTKKRERGKKKPKRRGHQRNSRHASDGRG